MLSLGFLDRLFGEKVTMEMQDPDGSTKTIVVTKKWLERMEAEGRIKTSEPSVGLASDPQFMHAWYFANLIVSETEKSFPDLADIFRSADRSILNFFITVAIFQATDSRLAAENFGPARTGELRNLLFTRLREGSKHAEVALTDCAGFCAQSPLSEADSLGKWIFWNTLDRPPETYAEVELVRVLGQAVVTISGSWWDRQNGHDA